jgi:hypothetical protein
MTKGNAKLIEAHLSGGGLQQIDLAAQRLVHKRSLLDHRDAA